MDAIKPVQQWLETVVIDLNLCPFARRELINNRIRFYSSEATTPKQLLLDLNAELELLNNDDSIETTLLIHPCVLEGFLEYNQFLDVADKLLVEMNLEGIFQIASFHPQYQFADTGPDDVENYSNRSPYPLMHLIREESLERAIANYPDVDKIPERNIALLNRLGRNKMQALLQSCFDEAEL